MTETNQKFKVQTKRIEEMGKINDEKQNQIFEKKNQILELLKNIAGLSKERIMEINSPIDGKEILPTPRLQETNSTPNVRM